ncbi:MAG: ABC transporter permease [Aquabacterium sp.]|jgi:ABC-2 type transport system permease protein|uniref:ABC transporter permease n=1 Tax=Aquabacterium sp. TaxID=1872578 RepID=UPI001B55D47A|nr:ABC transporter permease [Aquabacterium sp.]MBP7131646.1 ABC transporter permease [Aquabacterium sp.]MBP9063904.1 ABC transporter permease [Aquabacterium sp.]MDQ5927147.1 type transport system permease protein [Pseudomonadota bacterium]
MIWFINVFYLSLKELRCVLRDRTMMGAILISFTVAVYVVAVGAKADVTNVTIGIIDHDQSGLSHRIRAALRPPMFQTPVDLTPASAQAAMDEGKFLFIVEIPEQFEANIHGQRATSVQLTVDATAMAQAQLGIAYITEIVLRETLSEFKVDNLDKRLPTRQVVRVLYNPNTITSWFTSVMQLINNVTVLSVVLVGAAVIRERERGTIEHLLVMPVRPSEIAVAKILANGLVILLAVAVSVVGIIGGVLGVPIEGSVGLFLVGTGLYLFSLTALGILLATVASSMPQFGLLAVPVFVIMYMLSGSATPFENMPYWLQHAMQLSPSTHYVLLAQGILYRAAGFDIVWPQMVAVGGIGVAFLALALMRFRSMLARQG